MNILCRGCFVPRNDDDGEVPGNCNETWEDITKKDRHYSGLEEYIL